MSVASAKIRQVNYQLDRQDETVDIQQAWEYDNDDS